MIVIDQLEDSLKPKDDDIVTKVVKVRYSNLNGNHPTPKRLKSSLIGRVAVAAEKRKAASYVKVTDVTKKSKSVLTS